MSVEVDLFFRVLKNARTSEYPGDYFDDGVKTVFEEVCGFHDLVAWMRLDWPDLELYLYETSGRDRLDAIIDAGFYIVSSARPREHGIEAAYDWIVRVKIP